MQERNPHRRDIGTGVAQSPVDVQTNHEAPSSSTSWNVCSSCARFRPSDRARRFPSAPTCEGTASTSPSSAGTRPASASTCSTAPRTPRRPAASSSTRRGTRRATSGTSGSKGFGPGSSMAFASPDRTRPTTGIASTRTSWCWIPAPRRLFRWRIAILDSPSATTPRRLRRTCRSPTSTTRAPRPSASSRTRTSTGTAISRSACRGPRP